VHPPPEPNGFETSTKQHANKPAEHHHDHIPLPKYLDGEAGQQAGEQANADAGHRKLWFHRPDASFAFRDV
jgi:hypothetical protein